MENVVSIVKSRENELEFDISIQGVDDEGTQVRFVLETTPASLIFNCEHKEGDKWIVKIPPTHHIEAMTYQFHIEIVVGGYFFTPFKGTINVTNEPEVKSSGVGATVVAPVVKAAIVVNGEEPEEETKEVEAEEKEVEAVVKAEVEEEAEEEKEEKEEEPKPIPDEYKNLADELINNHKKKKAKETEQGKKVKEVLKDLEKEKKEDKEEEPEEKPKKKKAAKKKAAPKKKKEKVEEHSPFIIPRGSNLNSIIDDFKKPAEVDEQAKKVQNILKTLH